MAAKPEQKTGSGIMFSEPIGERRASIPYRRWRLTGYTVCRVKEDGSLDWFTWHWTHRAARKAADLYVATGRVKGHVC